MSKNVKKSIETGLRLVPISISGSSVLGDLEVSSISSKITFHNGSTASPIVTEAHAATLTVKTIVVANNTITTAASGNLSATELNAALAELQTDIDTRATSSALTAHISDTTTHGTTGDIVGTIDVQTLTNKTIGDYLTLANIPTPVPAPSAGFSQLYFKTDGLLYRRTSASVETAISNGALIRQTANTKAAPLSVASADTITVAANQRGIIYVQGSGGDVTLTSLIQITAGTLTEQELLVVGTNDSNRLTFVNGNGLGLKGIATLGAFDQILLRFDGDIWTEVSRNF